ncbi:DUF805 domain-containing protein [Moraxella bovis]|uniref:DUF805 domain-containing protein n=2 Tax=Moraxella bovis TaxID=476 RepID=UPI000DC7BCCC|nr:DUF805 domain-containing protein [Moraxella bovis]AWY20576.1 hypothetical protein DQF64_08795 [Moraxella bovis]UYZ82220.1 DUF805 domain-containing protein [Moraxella bovis]UYZ88439.1 DUF805 domain-containing protein [Moraxella bovis]UYZ93804.1 DUF805 domain-containing protein [Moraxella bovis]UZA07242.1 DUF805 domain-containing protein [Moraxella bovis]
MTSLPQKMTLGLKSALFDNFYNYEGRASRLEFFSFFIFYWLFLIVLAFILESLKLDVVLNNVILLAVFTLLTLAKLSVSSRRLHDSNLSSYWFILNFIPIIGSLIFLGLMFRKGSKGENRFGAMPSF